MINYNTPDRNSEPSANRDHLQRLTLAELMHEAHDMAARLPDRFLSPDRAWQWLRLTIEPMSFDIRSENTLEGWRYVGYWAGEPVCSVPMIAVMSVTTMPLAQ